MNSEDVIPFREKNTRAVCKAALSLFSLFHYWHLQGEHR